MDKTMVRRALIVEYAQSIVRRNDSADRTWREHLIYCDGRVHAVQSIAGAVGFTDDEVRAIRDGAVDMVKRGEADQPHPPPPGGA